jgi:hypothetical protein
MTPLYGLRMIAIFEFNFVILPFYYEMHIIGRLQGDLYLIPWRAVVDGEIEVGKYAVWDQTQHTEVVMS